MEADPLKKRSGLFDPKKEHSNCGVGVLVDIEARNQHDIIEDAFQILENLDHRGARGSEENTGDGAGMLIQKPHKYFNNLIPDLGDADSYGVGMAFFPREMNRQNAIKEVIRDVARKNKFRIVAWRRVPTDNTSIGKSALKSEPVVFQFFVVPESNVSPERLDIKLYLLRRLMEKEARQRALWGEEIFYICSLDRRVIVYKGLLTCGQLRTYYPELSSGLVTSNIALVHSRFSTNTLGSWDLAHPFRKIVHNGEINTLRGNLNWMKTREPDLHSRRFGSDIEKLYPITPDFEISDSAGFDHVLELLIESGRSLPKALRMMIPEAWSKDNSMDENRRTFYDYFSTIMEPWDGPALVVATDGYRVAGVLDRNGLRPCRYWLTEDQKLIMSSETGVLDIPPGEIQLKGRLKPGQLFMVDTLKKRIIPEDEIFDELTEGSYSEWLDKNRVSLKKITGDSPINYDLEPDENLERWQSAFGYTIEYMKNIIEPMAVEGKDPIGAMGNDAPYAFLSKDNKSLFNYFIQQFAQVSNPALDYIREELVTSLRSHIGRKQNLLEETPEHCRQLQLDTPILSDYELESLKNINENGIRAKVIDLTYNTSTTLLDAVEEVRNNVSRAINGGYEILILSDRNIDKTRLAIPNLLAVGAVHHHLIREGKRTRAGLVIESGEACLVHHFCTLLGYGADAINPWLAYQSIAKLRKQGYVKSSQYEAEHSYRIAVEKGIQKVMSKMGISTLESYKGAQIFETVGLSFHLVQEYFAGTSANISGVTISQIEKEYKENHTKAYSNNVPGNLSLKNGGEFYWRRDGEIHAWNPLTIGKLQHAVRYNDYGSYKDFANYINNQQGRLQTIRGLLTFKTDKHNAIPVEDVEPVEEIVKRFSTGSMSFGALSKEAHETLAIAMNRLGGKAGTGEGGEQQDRFNTERECSMKQVASGRFGVNIDYLAQAKQIEIKIAQGSKPGEGGELPGRKVNEEIAEVRFTVPGVGLISPPPHHDIYSIEDLAQLIHDLKCANPSADIHVKLVTKTGVGTIAAGVAKAKADAILISGSSGGTGASVKTSIKNAGGPWELGLSETHQVLLANNLRSRITLRSDGGFRTGRDVVIAALLGAEEYGFGTAPLITVGCIMLRKCHCNTCSVGVATQDTELRKQFPGAPEHVMNYMLFMAREVREYMAELGCKTMQEMIGRVDLLKQNDVDIPKAFSADLSQIIYKQHSDDDPVKTMQQNHKLDNKLDHKLISKSRPALDRKHPVVMTSPVRNRDRSVGTMLSSTIAKRVGGTKLPDDTITINFNGSAGQSFGAFLAKGVSFHLTGDANDYVGKGISGGKISIMKPPKSKFKADENIIIGNVALYGATAGQLYVNGQAGERFAVRNSGALAVVEGIGDHGCEYMTGGCVVVLGETGKNFGAGMSGGEAYVYDPNRTFERKVNPEMVYTDTLKEERDIKMVKRLLENHVSVNKSHLAKLILEQWQRERNHFIKVIPDAYQKVLTRFKNEGKDIRIPVPEKIVKKMEVA